MRIKNGVNVGNGSSITFLGGTINNNDSVWCVLTSNSACATTPTATSSKVKMIVKAVPLIGSVKNSANVNITSLVLCNTGATAGLYNNYGVGIWSSSNPSVATAVNGVAAGGGMSSSGLITAVSNGTATAVYTITSANGCSSVAYTTIVVDTLPALNNTIVSGSVCVNSNLGLVNMTTIPSGGTSVWTSLNNRASVNASSGVVTCGSVGTASIKYTITNMNGCSNSITTPIVINSLPNVPSIGYTTGTVNPQTGPAGSYCNNRTFTLVGNPTGGVWSTTNAAVVTVTSAGLTKTIGVGTGSILYTYTDANGCSNSRATVGIVAACATRGVNGIENGKLKMENEFTMYPNPAKTFISLNVKTLIGSGSIVITDLYGKQIKTQTLSMGMNTIDVSRLSKGIYFVSTITNEGKVTKKLVVE
jgi:Secretion system C-terminal sorting domain